MKQLCCISAGILAAGLVAFLVLSSLWPRPKKKDYEYFPAGKPGKPHKSIFDYPVPPANPLADRDLWVGLFMIILFVIYVALYLRFVQDGWDVKRTRVDALCADREDPERGS